MNGTSIAGVEEFFESIRAKGARLWCEQGKLRYSAPVGALTVADKERLRTSKREIVELLERAASARVGGSTLGHRPHRERAPLSFSQAAHWHLYDLSKRQTMRQVASVTRLQGRLDIDAFRKAVSQIVSRHDALRTRIDVRGDMPMQIIDSVGGCELEMEDLSAFAEQTRGFELVLRIEEILGESFDIANGPLAAIRLLKLTDDEYVLILALEHIISDALSLSILTRDVFAAYSEARNVSPACLPGIPIQFADYAFWQRSNEGSWLREHQRHWNQCLERFQRTRFPTDNRFPIEAASGWGSVKCWIEAELIGQLREWSRQRRTTIALSAFTAYVALVLRWCDVSKSVIQYQINGRDRAEVENTIGCFTSLLYVEVELGETDSFVELLSKTTQAYCAAYGHADYSYLCARHPRPEFARNTSFNWSPRGTEIDMPKPDPSEESIVCSPMEFVHPIVRKLDWDHEPMMQVYDADRGLVVDLYYPLDRFSACLMERFARSFKVFIEALVRHPETPVREVPL